VTRGQFTDVQNRKNLPAGFVYNLFMNGVSFIDIAKFFGCELLKVENAFRRHAYRVERNKR
jgi:hypothetical protein